MPTQLVDDGDDLVELPITVVRGFKNNVDGSVTFKMFGGPYHNQKVRVYKPFMRVLFDHSNKGILVYKLHPPVRTSGLWVYAYDPDDLGDMTEDEKGDPIDQEASARWMTYLAFKKQQALDKLIVPAMVDWEEEDEDGA